MGIDLDLKKTDTLELAVEFLVLLGVFSKNCQGYFLNNLPGLAGESVDRYHPDPWTHWRFEYRNCLLGHILWESQETGL